MLFVNYFMKVQFHLFFLGALVANIGTAAFKIRRNLWRQILPESCFIYIIFIAFSLQSQLLLDESLKTFLTETCCTAVMAIGLYSPAISLYPEHHSKAYFLWNLLAVILCIPAICIRIGLFYI